MKSLKRILPDYPRTPHVPWKPNVSQEDDIISTEKDADIILHATRMSITEKIDGANCAMALHEGNPVVRNKTHILNKAFVKDTPAKKQFSSIFTWFYAHKQQFEIINELAGPVGVYGEWTIAQHGLEYDLLPSLFIAFDLYDYEQGNFIASDIARKYLQSAGFAVVPELFFGKIENFQQLENYCNQPSEFTTKGNREGVYVKINDDRWVTHRFKMVRSGFKQGGLWDTTKFKKNRLKSVTDSQTSQVQV